MNKISILFIFIFACSAAKAETAIFAGGCFWCMEAEYQDVPGVTDVVSGFTGGTIENPTYSGNHHGHFEAVEVTYVPEVITYSELLDIFWRNIDPFDNHGQFCDKGPSYRSALFPVDKNQQALANASIRKVAEQFPGQNIHTEIRDANTFWPVEENHQDYYIKNPIRYKFYRNGCRRDARLKQIWGPVSDQAH